MAAPTYVQEAETAWGNSTTPKGSGNFTTNTGDRVVSLAIAESADGNDFRLDATGTNVTLSIVAEPRTSSSCHIEASTATVASGGTTSVSFAGSLSLWFGGNALTFRDSDGFGAVQSAALGNSSISITTTQANSAIVVAIGDYDAADGSSRTWQTVNSITPTSGNGFELTYFRDGAHYTVYIAYYPDAGSVGAKTVGLSSPTGSGFNIVAIEVKGTTGGGSPALDDSGTFPGFEAQSSPTVISIW